MKTINYIIYCNLKVKKSQNYKMEAAIEFVQSKEGRTAIISSLECAKKAILGETGTKIY